jgi:hypothetical protein
MSIIYFRGFCMSDEARKTLNKMVSRKRVLSSEKSKLTNRLKKVDRELELLTDDLETINKIGTASFIAMKEARDIREKEESEILKAKKQAQKIQAKQERENEKARKQEEAEAKHKKFRDARRQEVIANAKSLEEEEEYKYEDED